jgi:hypothetical protein
VKKLASLALAGALVAAMAIPAFAANVNTSATVTSELALTMTGNIAFGNVAALSNDNAGSTVVATIVSNYASGYKLEAIATALTETGGVVDVIPASGFEMVAAATDVSDATPTIAAAGAVDATYQLAAVQERSLEAGDDFTISSTLDVPYVEAGAYTGTATFTATSL